MAPKEKDKEAEQQDLLEVIETDANGKPLNAAAPEADGEAEGEDKRLSPDAQGDDDKDDDKPDADPEREKLRQERRLRRKIMKDMRRESQASEKRELEELRRITADQAQRLKQIEQNQTGTMEQTLKERLQGAVRAYEAADRDVGLAIEAGDGTKAREAMKARDDAKDAAQNFDLQLRRIKAPAPERVGPDPQEASLYKDWLAKNDWYDPNQGNEESRLAMAINQTLLQEGYRANTPAFWNELSSRSERFIRPKKAARNDDDDDRPARSRGGPPVGGSGREAAPSGKLQVFVTPERRRAMEEAGVWDDPTARNKMLRRYAEYDRNQPNAR